MSRGFGANQDRRAQTSHDAVSSNVSDRDTIGRGVRIRGRVSGDADLLLDGEIEGDVKLGGALELGPGGAVTGNVHANSVVVEGSITGDIEATGAVAIRAGARVSGNVAGAEISLDEGAVFAGRIEADFEMPDGLLPGAGGPAARRAPAAQTPAARGARGRS
ncbi:MAG: polymer-forming cytoskeletal protein [Polyangiaceae bacterium]